MNLQHASKSVSAVAAPRTSKHCLGGIVDVESHTASHLALPTTTAHACMHAHGRLGCPPKHAGNGCPLCLPAALPPFCWGGRIFKPLAPYSVFCAFTTKKGRKAKSTGHLNLEGLMFPLLLIVSNPPHALAHALHAHTWLRTTRTCSYLYLPRHLPLHTHCLPATRCPNATWTTTTTTYHLYLKRTSAALRAGTHFAFGMARTLEHTARARAGTPCRRPSLAKRHGGTLGKKAGAPIMGMSLALLKDMATGWTFCSSLRAAHTHTHMKKERMDG